MGIREDLLNLILEQQAKRGAQPRQVTPQFPVERRTLPPVRWATEQPKPVTQPRYQVTTAPPTMPELIFPSAEEQYQIVSRQPITLPIVRAPMAEPEKITQDITPKAEWWEQPKVWGEKAQEAVGAGISKLPVIPKVLEWAAPAFEVLHNVERAFATVLLSPFSPRLPYRKGENWFEHEQREYDTWQAPTYVKGLAEFAPWMLPIFGWLGAAGRALGLGAKLAKQASAISKMGKLALPTEKFLTETLYQPNFFRRIAYWAESKPILKQVVEKIGGPAAFVKPFSDEPLEIARRALVNRSVILSSRNDIKTLLLPRLQQYGNSRKVLGVSDKGLVGSFIQPVREGLGKGINDVAENFAKDPKSYKFIGAEGQLAKKYLREAIKIKSELEGLLVKEGIIKKGKELPFHRLVLGKETEAGFIKTEYGSLFEVARHHATMDAGVAAGIKYSGSVPEVLESMVNYYIKRIADKRFDSVIGAFGKTAMQRMTELYPELVTELSEKGIQYISAKHALQAVKQLQSYAGTKIPSATLKKIREGIGEAELSKIIRIKPEYLDDIFDTVRNGLPELAERMRFTLQLAPEQANKILAQFPPAFWKAVKITPSEFKVRLAQYVKTPGFIQMGEVEATLKSLNINKALAGRALTKLYKEAYKLNRASWDDAITGLRNEVANILIESKTALKPLAARRSQLLTRLGQEAHFEGLAKFRWAPGFGGKLFDEKIVNLVDKAFADKGQGWLRAAAETSGLGRVVVAALDLSAPFIQGLPVLGRNPVVWAKATAEHYGFFLKPENLKRYLNKPLEASVRNERILAGGSGAYFEYVESMPLLREIGEKVGGRVGEKVVEVTYGRAEAAFVGFGEVARNELWKALKRPGMNEGQLRELARSIDRMTGQLSTEALGIGLSQRQMESAFVFFSPRYTRAGLSLVGDALRGGLAGSEARKAIGGMMAGGMAMYYGVTKALGQEAYLDPTSAKFLTIKVGEHRVGIGGIMYALTRLGAGIVASATNDPATLVDFLNRQDNPFTKFMFSRAAPLTGVITGVIEQKNFLGEPFENVGDWAAFMAEHITPIAMQEVMPWKEAALSPAVFGSAFIGARTFPKSAWELRDEARDSYASQAGKIYDQLNELEQKRIDEMPDIAAFTKEIQELQIRRGRGLDVAFANWQQERELLKLFYENELQMAENAVTAGLLTGYDFKERLQAANYGYRMGLEVLTQRPEYKEVYTELGKGKENIDKQYIGDIAFAELTDGLYGGQFEDEFGIYDYDAADIFRESIRVKYGDTAYNYALERLGENRKKLPLLAQEYYKAQEVLKPYWDIQKDADRYFGKADSDNKQAFISRRRKALRTLNPQIARYYSMFYQRGAK